MFTITKVHVALDTCPRLVVGGVGEGESGTGAGLGVGCGRTGVRSVFMDVCPLCGMNLICVSSEINAVTVKHRYCVNY